MGSKRIEARAANARASPWVTVKLAQTLDGRIATATGHSQWISGAESLRLAHELRATHDAVLVGVGTVIHDDPRLTVRHVPGKDPLRVVADTSLRSPPSAHVLADRPETTLFVAGAHVSKERVRALTDRGARVVLAQCGADGRLDLDDVLRRLAEEGIRSLMVEGGAAIVTSLLRGGLVDRMVICIAPKLLGAGLEAIGDLGIRKLGDALTFSQSSVRQLGPDIIFDGILGERDARAGGPQEVLAQSS